MVIKIGDTFGYLEVVSLNNAHSRGNSWLCKCVCGKEKVFYTSDLIGAGKSLGKGKKSCGCKKFNRDGLVSKDIRLYKIWYAMNSRCYDERHASFERYGAKGIRVDEVWRSEYEPFYKWAMANGYESHLTIDRIDSTKNYSPDNCRWASYLTQMQNRGTHKNNTSGVQGASKEDGGRYRVSLTRDFKCHNLGTYDTLEECEIARNKALSHYEKTGTLEGYKPQWKRLRKKKSS